VLRKRALTSAIVVVLSLQVIVSVPVSRFARHGFGGKSVRCVMVRVTVPSVGAPAGQLLQVALPETVSGQPKTSEQKLMPGTTVALPVAL